MSSLEAGIRVRRAISITTGSISAATPILFMNAERAPAVSMTTTIMRPSRLPASRRTVRPIALAMPARVRPSLRINIAQTAITAAFENPATASSGVTSSVRTRVPITMSAIRSIRIFSLTNRTSEAVRMVRTRLISNVKIYLPIGVSSPRFPSADVMELLNCGILNVQASSRKLVVVYELRRFIKYDVFRLQGVRINGVCGAILISNWLVFLRLTKLYSHGFWIRCEDVEIFLNYGPSGRGLNRSLMRRDIWSAW